MITFLEQHLINPLASAMLTFWSDVFLPLIDTVSGWILRLMPWCGKFADFVFSYFKLRFTWRLYSLMVMVPLAVIILFSVWLGRKYCRRKELRKRRNKMKEKRA